MKRETKHDILMACIVVPVAVLSAIVLYIGAKDVESRRERQELSIKLDSVRKQHRELQERSLKTLEDSVHYYEDGM